MTKFVILVATLVTTLFVNFMANYLPINGITTGEVSSFFFNYFTPANYVFSIWLVIYLAQILMYFAIGFDLKKYGKYLDKIYPWLLIVNLANVVWMLAWHYKIIELTVPFMVLILLALIQFYLITRKEKSLPQIFKFTSSVYLGWINVATIANLSAFFSAYGYSPMFISKALLVVVLMVVAVALSLAFVKFHKDYIVLLVAIWAIIGIVVKFQDSATIFYGGLATVALAVASLIFLESKKKK